MPKVKITITIDVPDNDYFTDPDAPAYMQQELFDEVINFNTCSHLEDAVTWLAEAGSDKKSTAYQIHEHHLLWGRIMKNCKWDFKVEK